MRPTGAPRPCLLYAAIAAVGLAAITAPVGCDSRQTPDRVIESSPASQSPPQQSSDTRADGASAAGPSLQSANAAARGLPAHQRMLSVLAAIKELSATDNRYVSDKEVREWADRLASLPANVPNLKRIEALGSLANAELFLGRVEEAIEHFTQALELLNNSVVGIPPGLRDHTQFMLGVSWLRLGEVQNCCQSNNPESCILPIQGGGLHARPEGSRQAIRHFTEVARMAPTGSSVRLSARWLLNIAHMTIGEYPAGVDEDLLLPPELFAAEVDFPRFPNIAESLRVDALNSAGGAIVDDFDGDGSFDLVTTSMDPRDEMRFYRHRAGEAFDNRTEPASLSGLYGGLNAVHADYDNDGFLDILVLRGAWLGAVGKEPNSLLRNNGDGTFSDVSYDAGLAGDDHPTQTASWADYDLDGDLDLYVGGELEGDDEGKSPAPGRAQLFRNEGDGRFSEVAAEAGVLNEDYAKGVDWGDVNGDRWPDLYVSNLGTPNRLFLNNRDGTFTDVATETGVAQPLISFPCWFWDYDNDGALDLWVGTYSARIDTLAASYLGLPIPDYLPCLYRGDGRGGFVDVAAETNLARPHLVMGCNYGDLNNDGYLDCYFGTGDPHIKNLMPNAMYLNQGGQRFVDVATPGGFGHLQKGHGVAFADIDDDGDQDVFEQMGGAYAGDKYHNCLYENPGFGNHSIKVRLVGTQSNRAAWGARVRAEIVENGQRRSIYRHVDNGGSFGANPLQQHIGVGRADVIETLEVFWPVTGQTQVYHRLPVDRSYGVVEGNNAIVTFN